MFKFAGMTGGGAVGAATAVGVVLVAGGLYLGGVIGPKPDAALPEGEAVIEKAALEPEVAPGTGEDAAPPEPEQEAAALPDAPRIDTFRLDPAGELLVAGHAPPGWQTFVMLDDTALDAVAPDAQGQFVSFLSLDASAAPRVLSLETRDETGRVVISSEEEIVVAPVLSASADTDGDIVQDAASDASAQPAQAVLRTSDEGVEVVQPAVSAGAGPDVMSSVALDAITYSEAGDVQLAGRGQGNRFVRLYLDNQPVGGAEVAADGNWRTDLPEVDTGVYTLRVDEVDAAGQVTSRVETPFKREDETVLAQAADAEARVSAVTVQPGSTLWAISRERYGEGVLYVRVFEANKDRIRDPDLIYPGQVFTLPE